MRIDRSGAEQGHALITVNGTVTGTATATFGLWLGSGFGPAQLSTCGVNP